MLLRVSVLVGLTLLAAGPAAILIAELTRPTYRWHQKLTVTIETPEGEKRGASVSAIEWTKGFNWSMGWNQDFHGDAVVVDLGTRGYLFALTRRFDNSEWLGSVAPGSISGRSGRPLDEQLFDEVAEKRGRAAGTIVVSKVQWPIMVKFGNIIQPTTVTEVDPSSLESSFGPGVKLRSITLEITDAPITTGAVVAVLPWLPEIWPNHLDGKAYETINAKNRLANALSVGDFTTEIARSRASSSRESPARTPARRTPMEIRLAFDAGGRDARLGSDRAFSGDAGVVAAGNRMRDTPGCVRPSEI